MASNLPETRSSGRRESMPEETQPRDDASERLRHLMALREIERAMADTPDVREIYRAMFREVVQPIFGAPHLAVALFDSSTDTIACGFAIVDGVEMDVTQFPRIPLGEGPVSATIRTLQPRIVDLRELGPRLKANGRAVQVGDDRQPQSALYVPLVRGKRVMGVMYAQHYEVAAFHETEVTLMSILAGLAVMALDDAHSRRADAS